MKLNQADTGARGSVLSGETDRARETRTNLLEWRSYLHVGFIRGDLIVWREAPSRNYTTPLSSFVLYFRATQSIKTRHEL